MGVTEVQPELMSHYYSLLDQNTIFAPVVSGPSNCKASYSSGHSLLLWCNEGTTDLDTERKINKIQFQHNGEYQECTFALGNVPQPTSQRTK
jgi:hypothetical protein